MKRSKIIAVTSGIMLSSLFFGGCNDELLQEPKSSVTNEALSADNLLLAAYASLRPYFANSEYWAHNEISSDEAHAPQRGGDWADNGQWTQLHQHTWTPTHPLINGPWETAYRGIARTNDVLEKIGTPSTDAERVLAAEARFLRAFFYYQLVDLYGNVPILTTKVDPDNYPDQTPRAQVAQFIIDETTAIVDDLPLVRPANEYGRITRGAAQMLLAKMYLNAEVFQGTPQWQNAFEYADAVINSGVYSLTNTSVNGKAPYLSNFDIAYDGPANREYIFIIGFVAAPQLSNQGNTPVVNLGNTANMWSNHYSYDRVYGNGQSPWNGFTTLAEFYNSYDPDDDRRDVWLVGPQVDRSGEPLTTRQGAPLVYTPEVPVTGASEGQGIRLLKWGIDPNAIEGQSGNDFAIFRLADAYLMKAEAALRLGNVADALAAVNTVRARAFEPDEPLATVTLDDILRERGHEFSWEAFRRQDLIRFGEFLEPNATKPQVSEPFRVLYPIPQRQIDINPKLQQNPGYGQ